MSGIYIPGMEMPKSCHECVAGYGGCCFVAPAEADGICPDHGRADFCPLIPVPDHGDLIERDMMHEMVNWEISKPPFSRKKVRMMIDAAPTIIPAEEGEG